MPELLKLTFILTLWIPAVLSVVTTSGERTVLEGQSVTVPCHYEPQYAGYVKYWCRGRTREFCSSLARTDEPRSDDPAQPKASITDDPVQQVSTVTMDDLKEADTGWYSCGVEVGGGWTPDVVRFTYINVIHGLSVAENKVVGEEGGGVSVECHYSERLRGKEKKWCRMGDWSSCRLSGSEGTYEDASVSISDDGNRTFTVTLKTLQLSDAGWYWCSVGQVQLGVEVLVTPRTRTRTMSLKSPLGTRHPEARPPPPEHSESSNSHWLIGHALVASCSLLVLMVMGNVLWRIYKPQHPALKQEQMLRQVQVEKGKLIGCLDVSGLKVA